jgi:hypothetical protein
MRACNPIQIVVRCGRILADSSLGMRACLASGAGHVAALITMAIVVAGGGRDTHSLPFLTVSASDELAAVEPEHLAQTPSEELDPLIQPTHDGPAQAIGEQTQPVENPTIAEWLSQNTASPAAWAGQKPGAGELAGAFTQVAAELNQKGAQSAGNLGQKASFYGVEAEGRNFIFVVDTSGSMSGSRFRRARAELCRSIEHLHPDQSFFVILFNNVPALMPSFGMAAADPASLRLLENWLRKTECNGGTNPMPALIAALAMKPDAVYLLSDGKFDPALAQTVSQLQVFQRIPVHTIGFASRKGEPMLKAISQVSGGTYRHVR